MEQKIFKDFQIGQKVSISRIFTQEEVAQYSLVSEDKNPIHFDSFYSSQTFFKKPIIQGLLVTSLFGGLLGSYLPGPGTIHLGQSVRFLRPVYVNEVVTAEIEIVSKREDKSIIVFACKIIKENGDIAITGEETVMYKGPYFK